MGEFFMTHTQPALMRIILTIVFTLCFNSTSFASDHEAVIVYSEDIIEQEVDMESWNFYQLETDTAAKITIKLRKISDDADLYVLQSKKPTKDAYTCAPKKSGSSIETCRITSNDAGIWYIGVYGKEQSDYQLGIKTKDLSLISQINN